MSDTTIIPNVFHPDSQKRSFINLLSTYSNVFQPETVVYHCIQYSKQAGILLPLYHIRTYFCSRTSYRNVSIYNISSNRFPFFRLYILVSLLRSNPAHKNLHFERSLHMSNYSTTLYQHLSSTCHQIHIRLVIVMLTCLRP